MVCSLHSVTTGSRDRANVSLIIIIRWATPRQHYTVDPMLLPLRNPFTCHEDVLSLKAMIPPSVFDIFSPCCVGRSEVLDAFRFFFKQQLIGFDRLIDWILT